MEQKLKNAASHLPEADLDFDTVAARATVAERSGGRRKWKVVIAVAACMAVLMSVSFWSYAAEVKEYHAAVQFFAENGLSTEGLSREQIKAVYRDITTKSFSYDKTAEVIQNSMTREEIKGFEILQGTPAREDIENLWLYKLNGKLFVPYVRNGYNLTLDFIINDQGLVVGEVYYLEKYEQDELIWRTEVPAWYGRAEEVADGVIACVNDTRYDTGKPLTENWILKTDHQGTILWCNRVDNGFDKEFGLRVLENDDGSYTLFGTGDNRYLCVSRYSADGQRMEYTQTDMGSIRIGHVAHYGDGYLLQVSASNAEEFARFIRLDQQGNVVDGFSYSDETYSYSMQDMVEWGGKVYVSAYAIPKLGGDEPGYGLGTEIDKILDYIDDQKKYDISNEELTSLVRDHYTAVLLVCDPADGGKMQTFYTISGSLGAELVLTEDGRLIWETESIVDIFLSLGTSSFTIGGYCGVYQTSFDLEGNLLAHVITDEVINFRR